jgi:hypothetical protein
MLLEKALAKLHGSYFHMSQVGFFVKFAEVLIASQGESECMSVSDALAALTGESVLNLDLHFLSREQVWTNICYGVSRSWVVSCSRAPELDGSCNQEPAWDACTLLRAEAEMTRSEHRMFQATLSPM